MFFYVDLFKSQTILLLLELSILVFFTKADRIGFESKGHTNETRKLLCRSSSLFCLFVFFRVIGIDSKHDVFINQEVFPVQEGLGN